MTEIDKHNIQQLDDWDRHWDELNDQAEENPAQQYRHQLLYRMICSEFANRNDTQTIIDFGSGQGDLIRLLLPIAAQRRLIGMELGRNGVEVAKRKATQGWFHDVNLVT